MSEMTSTGRPTGNTMRALKILAKSVHRELKSSGYSRSDIVCFTNDLLDLVTEEMRDESEEEDLS